MVKKKIAKSPSEVSALATLTTLDIDCALPLCHTFLPTAADAAATVSQTLPGGQGARAQDNSFTEP
eukprot:60706-Pelagomonas_calceolata.AAC.3